MSAAPPPIKPPPKPKNLKFHRATFSHTAEAEDELSFQEGDLLYIVDDSDPSWWRARVRGKEGLIPSNFIMKSHEEISPFHDACKRGNLELLDECLLNQVPVNSIDLAGNTGIHWACRGGHHDCLGRLLQLGNQVKVDLENRLGDTPLHLAALKGSKACIELIKNFPNANIELIRKTNKEGKTAYDLATDPEAKSCLKSWMKQANGENEIDQSYEVSDEED